MHARYMQQLSASAKLQTNMHAQNNKLCIAAACTFRAHPQVCCQGLLSKLTRSHHMYADSCVQHEWIMNVGTHFAFFAFFTLGLHACMASQDEDAKKKHSNNAHHTHTLHACQETCARRILLPISHPLAPIWHVFFPSSFWLSLRALLPLQLWLLQSQAVSKT